MLKYKNRLAQRPVVGSERADAERTEPKALRCLRRREAARAQPGLWRIASDARRRKQSVENLVQSHARRIATDYRVNKCRETTVRRESSARLCRSRARFRGNRTFRRRELTARSRARSGIPNAPSIRVAEKCGYRE